jgi:hypothetical protein
MTRFLTYCFDTWWRPILYFGLTLGLVLASEFIENNIFGNISFLLFGLGLLGLVISTIYQLINGRWLKAILTGLLFGGTIAAFVFYTVFLFFIETVDGDKWADNLKIPTNIQLDTPVDLTMGNQRQDSIMALTKSKTDFQLYNSFQPGLYEFDFWTGKIERGTIYLQAFEITQEYALSTDRLPERSAIKIYNPTDSILKFSTTSDFTIYEGDWGKPYAARFEVWFKPDNGGKERKLFVKNYKIEGWQR